jgi:hypothetical protein
MEPNTLLTAQGPNDPTGYVDKERYQHLVGKLLYLTVWTRPDLVFATQQLYQDGISDHQDHKTIRAK